MKQSLGRITAYVEVEPSNTARCRSRGTLPVWLHVQVAFRRLVSSRADFLDIDDPIRHLRSRSQRSGRINRNNASIMQTVLMAGFGCVMKTCSHEPKPPKD